MRLAYRSCGCDIIFFTEISKTFSQNICSFLLVLVFGSLRANSRNKSTYEKDKYIAIPRNEQSARGNKP